MQTEINSDRILSDALILAEMVEPLKSQGPVLREIFKILLDFYNKGTSGHVLEIGCKKGKTTVFL